MTIDPLIPDVYAYDGRDAAELNGLVAAGAPWHGIMLKASDGLTPDAFSASWFRRMWRAALALDAATGFFPSLARSWLRRADHTREQALLPRLGEDWFVFAYHYWRRRDNNREQTLRYLREIEAAGGWTLGTTYAVVDAEEGQNQGASPAEVEDGVSTFVEVVRAETGRETVLYCGWWVREIGVRSKMGCRYVWPAAYTPHLDPRAYTDLGFTLEELLAWQYCGDGNEDLPDSQKLAGYPHTVPGLGPEDISAITIGLDHLRKAAHA